MKILITGGTGFIGRHLAALLASKEHKVLSVNSPSWRGPERSGNIVHMRADTTRTGPWQKEVEKADAVINLAGKTIFARWTKKYKRKIRDSRILTTRNIVEAMEAGRQKVFLSASAAGFYGCRGEESLTESASAGDDFLARVAVEWEDAASRAPSSVRVVNTRFGVVLGKGGGAAGQMIPAFSMYAGGPLGNGRQWFPWIHLSDLTHALAFLLEQPGIHGPVNMVSPNAVRNKTLTDALAGVLNRPAALAVPAFVLKTLMGELGETLLCSQRVIPDILIARGYPFLYPEIEDAFREITGKNP